MELPYVSNGNSKVKALIFNLPSGKTCRPNLACHKYCYAKKAERQYPQVMPCRERNLEISKQPDFPKLMLQVINQRRNNKYFRIHESGDFYSEEYILKWYTIAKLLPKTRFYAYTKRIDLFTEEILAMKPENLTLINSLDGVRKKTNYSTPKGFDKIAVTHESKTNCPAISGNVTCMSECRKCLNKTTKTIVFAKH